MQSYAYFKIPLETFVTDSQYMDHDQDFTISPDFEPFGVSFCCENSILSQAVRYRACYNFDLGFGEGVLLVSRFMGIRLTHALLSPVHQDSAAASRKSLDK